MQKHYLVFKSIRGRSVAITPGSGYAKWRESEKCNNTNAASVPIASPRGLHHREEGSEKIAAGARGARR